MGFAILCMLIVALIIGLATASFDLAMARADADAARFESRDSDQQAGAAMGVCAPRTIAGGGSPSSTGWARGGGPRSSGHAPDGSGGSMMTPNVALVMAVVSLAALAAAGCKSRSKGVGLADAGSAVAVELPMKSALNDSLAREVRELLHPTGNGGTSTSSRVACGGTSCTATWDIAWSGGLTKSRYSSTIMWTVDTSFESSAQVVRETSVIRADAKHIAQMNALLRRRALDFRPGPPEQKTDAAAAVDAEACPARPLDAARLARLVKSPTSERAEPHPDSGRHRGPHPTYDYAFPECKGLMLVTSQAKPTAWSLTCYESCLAPSSVDIGTLEHLADSEFKDPRGLPVRTKWFLITDGPLGGNVAAFTGTGDAPAVFEIDVESPGSIEEQHTDFIFGWICQHRSSLPGFDKKRCAER